MRASPAVLLAFLSIACHGSSSGSSSPELAAVTIGPEGGTIEVSGGVQAGLVFTIPAGALAAPTRIRVRDATRLAPPGALPTIEPAWIARPFYFEPAGLELALPGTLRAPYRVTAIANTAPGNVRLREVRNGNTIDHVPAVIDVAQGFVEFATRRLSWFEVRTGPRANGIGDYQSQVGAVVPLTGGGAFTVEPGPAPSPFPATTAHGWRLTSTTGDERLWFGAGGLVGREDLIAGWREVWSQPFEVWTPSPEAAINGATFPVAVSYPFTLQSTTGQMTAFGAWQWIAPREIDGRQLLDLLQLRVSLAWNRGDIGVGQKEYRFTFAPELGLVALSIDGVEQTRTDL